MGKSSKSQWSRSEKIGCASLVIALVAALAAVLVIPEVRQALGLSNSSFANQSNNLTQSTTTTTSTATNAYPHLKSSYSGNLICTTCTSTNASPQHLVLFSIIEDGQGNISGARTLDGQDQHTFKGNVTMDDHISFVVTLSDGTTQITYSGTVYTDGHLDGQWTRSDSGGGGTWSVS